MIKCVPIIFIHLLLNGYVWKISLFNMIEIYIILYTIDVYKTVLLSCYILI